MEITNIQGIMGTEILNYINKQALPQQVPSHLENFYTTEKILQLAKSMLRIIFHALYHTRKF